MRPKPSRPKSTANELPQEMSALLEQGDAAAADRLQEIGAGAGAEAKAARRALYLLKQRGIEPSAPPPSAQTEPAAPAPTAEIKGFLTNVSGSASQMAFFEEVGPYGGSPTFHFFLTNFTTGLEDITTRRIPRREVAEVLDRLKRGEGGVVVEAPADYVRHLVRQAADRIQAEGGRLPQGYAEAMRRVGQAEQTYDRSLVYDSISPETLAEDLSFSREPESFFQAVMFRSWFLGMEAVAQWEERYFDAVQSKFAVDQAQREALGDKVIEEAADALLDAKALRALRRALEEQATVMQLAGKTPEAKQALFHALSIDPEQPAHTNPFVTFYVKRSIFVVMAYKAELEPEPDGETEAEEPAAPLIERV